jgi:hypothetical protein
MMPSNCCLVRDRSSSEIELDLVAYSLGLELRYAPLKSCEARIVGVGNRGIITVRSGAHPRRQRFSIAHEIGHWTYHRRKALLCHSSDISEVTSATKAQEKIANDFASRLILPEYLLRKELDAIGNLSFQEIIAVANAFDASITATARKVVSSGRFPSVLIAYNRSGRAWFVSSTQVPQRWFPQKELHPDASAFSILFGGVEKSQRRRRQASLFFERPEASSHVVVEETFRVQSDLVLTLIHLEPSMLDSRTSTR